MEQFSRGLDTCPNCAGSLAGVSGCRCSQHDRTCPKCGKTVIILSINSGEHTLRVTVAVNFTDTHSHDGQKKIGEIINRISENFNHALV